MQRMLAMKFRRRVVLEREGGVAVWIDMFPEKYAIYADHVLKKKLGGLFFFPSLWIVLVCIVLYMQFFFFSPFTFFESDEALSAGYHKNKKILLCHYIPSS